MPKITEGCCTPDTMIVRPGTGIDVSGSGSADDPYIITTTILDFSESLSVRDTSTVDMQLLGSGNPDDPFILSANAAIKMQDIADIVDPAGPNAGDVPVFLTDHWEFAPPPANPAGSVNVGTGLTGSGAAATPLQVAVAAMWGSGELAGLGADSTIGLPVYADSTGVLRAKPGTASVSWTSVTGKPSTFAPSAHTHVAGDISATEQLKLNVGKINGKKITTAMSSSTKPSSPAVGDVFIFPKGS